jgi:hypothetical protein
MFLAVVVGLTFSMNLLDQKAHTILEMFHLSLSPMVSRMMDGVGP